MANKSTAQTEAEKAEVVEESLNDLETSIDRLKSMYEQYFLGIAKTAPTFLHNEVERRIRDLTQANIRQTRLRYKFVTQNQKFGSYNAYWRRTIREIESGKYLRNLSKIGRAAARNGAEIPEEILQAMPKRMREQVIRDRDAVIALAKRRGKLDDGADEFVSEDSTQEDGGLLELGGGAAAQDDDEVAIIGENPEIRKKLNKPAPNRPHQLTKEDEDFDLDAFFAQVQSEPDPPPVASTPPSARIQAVKPTSSPADGARTTQPLGAQRGMQPGRPPMPGAPQPQGSPPGGQPTAPGSPPGRPPMPPAVTSSGMRPSAPALPTQPGMRPSAPALPTFPAANTSGPARIQARPQPPAISGAPRTGPSPIATPAPMPTTQGVPGPARLPPRAPVAPPNSNQTMPGVAAPTAANPRVQTGPIPTMPAVSAPSSGPVPRPIGAAASQATRPLTIQPGSTESRPAPVVQSISGGQFKKSDAPAPPMRPPPGMSDADVNLLHANYIKAKQMVGEDAGPGSRDKLLRTINAQAPKIMDQYKVGGVDFSVVVKDNQVIIRAKPKGKL